VKRKTKKHAAETKDIHQGIRFKPTVWQMLTFLSMVNDESKAGCLERLIIQEFNKMKGGS